MANYVTSVSDKKKSDVLKKCYIGGWFGWHYYYVGRIGMGILYSCTLGFALMGWIYDIIRINLGSFKDNVGYPVREK